MNKFKYNVLLTLPMRMLKCYHVFVSEQIRDLPKGSTSMGWAVFNLFYATKNFINKRHKISTEVISMRTKIAVLALALVMLMGCSSSDSTDLKEPTSESDKNNLEEDSSDKSKKVVKSDLLGTWTGVKKEVKGREIPGLKEFSITFKEDDTFEQIDVFGETLTTTGKYSIEGSSVSFYEVEADYATTKIEPYKGEIVMDGNNLILSYPEQSASVEYTK